MALALSIDGIVNFMWALMGHQASLIFKLQRLFLVFNFKYLVGFRDWHVMLQPTKRSFVGIYPPPTLVVPHTGVFVLQNC
eukprot:501661-Rhodomonas_salina.1